MIVIHAKMISTVKGSNNDDSNRSMADKYIETIKHYEYSDFKNIEPIGKGAFGKVVRANWKSADGFVVLKSFINDKITHEAHEEVAKELRLHQSVVHENIIRLYGITKEIDAVYYTLVLEYADSGTLVAYLRDHFSELDWNDKYLLALQLASATKYLHENDIIHRDLHAGNILIHQKNIKIADFGLSKKISEKSSNPPKLFGVMPYMDPQSLNNSNYKLNKSSDVYSVGVLMWVISSGRQPFGLADDAIRLSLEIANGKRERVIDGTPIIYSNLYEECWKSEPNGRPNMKDVVSILKTISTITSNDQIDIIIKDDNESELSSHISLDLNNLSNINLSKNIRHESTSLLDIIEEIDNSGQETGTDTSESKNNLGQGTGTDILLYNITNMVVDQLIEIIIKEHDKGTPFCQIQQILDQEICQLNQKLNQDKDQIIKWLLKNQVRAKYIWILGLFYYYYNIETEVKAFELFSRAASDNYPIAKVYLARCYSDGYGTKHNKTLAFKYYQESVQNGSIIGQFYLGYCYQHGIGVEKDDKESVYWYEKAANNENSTAKLYLAECYKLGRGVKKDATKAFKYYETLARQEIADAQTQLGNCFYYGIGTRIDLDQALCWYTKATRNGNIIAKDILKKNYNKYLEINKKKSYKLSFSRKLSQLGTYYVGKIFLKTNYERSFHSFKKAAESGDKVAQFKLGNQYRTRERIEKNERKAFELFTKSAEQGYVDGIFRLGYCYDKGIGTDIDKAKAIELYRIAANEENSGAQNNLGLLYKNGDGVEKDLEKAFYWFSRSAKNESEVAKYNLGHCYKLGIGVEKGVFKAFEFYKKSAEKNYLDGKFQLGNCYNEGIGTEKNREKAFAIYEEIANKGHKLAQNSLGILYEKGEGTEKNFDMAFYWYSKAAKNGNEVAQFNLGLVCYEKGQGVEKDEVKAFELYKMSAEQGYIKALERLAYCYDMGIGTEVNKVKAFEIYKILAEKRRNKETEENSEKFFYY